MILSDADRNYVPTRLAAVIAFSDPISEQPEGLP